MLAAKIDWEAVKDLDELSEEGEASFVAIQLDRFKKSTDIAITNLSTAINEKNFKDIFDICHKLKSGCGVLGLMSPWEVCERMEKAAYNSEDKFPFSKEEKSLHSQIEASIATLEDYISQGKVA